MSKTKFPESLFPALLNQIGNGIIVTTSTTLDIIYTNRVAQQIFGYTEAEFCEKTMYDILIRLPETPHTETNIDDLEPKITAAKKRDKTTTTVEYCVRHLQIGKEIGHVYTIRDLSEFNLIRTKVMKMEEINTELRRAFRELKEKEGRLVQKERWVSIGQLSAGIAHEINNPLGFVENNLFVLDTYINKFAKMLKNYQRFISTFDNTMYQTAVDEIRNTEQELRISQALTDITTLFNQTHEGIHRMTTIIKSLKNFSQLEKVDEKTSFDVNEGLTNTLIICQNEHRNHAKINLQLGTLSPISCDPGKISQVFLNLIINAAQSIQEKFRNEKKGIITITTHQDDTHIYCSITDNGSGIPETVKPKIFDPFFTTKDPKIGTGLGLSLSFDIIQKHNGDIIVESTPGEGTTFTVKLPIK
jgi:PAS domain S-box-containing protein